jgi:D-arabinose 5-phosphate isomerase GutQ
MEYEDDPIIAEQYKLIEKKVKEKKAKVMREGQKFDSANHEIQRQKGKVKVYGPQ